MKKRYINKKTIFALTFAMLSFGCKKITDINVSPNNPPVDKASPQVLFSSGVMETAGASGGEIAIIGGIWSQYWTENVAASQFNTIDSYSLGRQDFNNPYSILFAGALTDYQLAITQAKTTQNYPFYLMCTVMKAFSYELLVDLYDQVPYTEAFQGATNVQPKFDDGFTIYKGLIAEIDAALATNYNTPLGTTDQKADLVFGGNMDQWRQFANTLKLKMYLRMVNTHAADAQAGIQALYAANADFLDSSAGILSAFSDGTDQRNPLYAYTVFNLKGVDLRASRTFTSWLVANNDTRTVKYFGTATPTPIDQGNHGATQADQPNYYKATAPVITAAEPVYFITKAESHFLQAEAGLRYSVVDAKTQFDLGVNAAFAQYGLTNPGTGVYDYTSSSNKLKLIIYQKWASWPNSHTIEGFFDQERTGFPENSTVYSINAADAQTINPSYIPGQWVYAKSGVTAGKFPKRLVFPNSERTRNSNTPAEVPITTPVWWGLTN